MRESADHPVYPIYSIKYSWPDDSVGCVNGKNGSSTLIMLKEESPEEIREIVSKTINRIAESEKVEPANITHEVELLRYEEWCLGWFGHWTFDIGLSDQEVLDSFQRYVDRIVQHNREHQQVIKHKDGEEFLVDDICLMGAEDRWRWTARGNGSSILGCGEETGGAPCRCSGCKMNGVVRIDH